MTVPQISKSEVAALTADVSRLKVLEARRTHMLACNTYIRVCACLGVCAYVDEWACLLSDLVDEVYWHMTYLDLSTSPTRYFARAHTHMHMHMHTCSLSISLSRARAHTHTHNTHTGVQGEGRASDRHAEAAAGKRGGGKQ